MRRSIHVCLAILVPALIAGACKDPEAPRGPGAISITASSQTQEPFYFEFGVSIDGGTPRMMVPFEPSTFLVGGLAHGSHTITVSSVPTTCTGGTPRTVSLRGDDTAKVQINLVCARTTGDLIVSVTTTGSSFDPNGYFVLIDQYPAMTIGVNATVTLPFLFPATRTISLGDVDSNCSASAAKTVTITAGGTATATFTVTCLPAAFIRLVTAATGADRDPDGISLAIDQGTPTQRSPSATQYIKVSAGAHTYAIADVQPNCTLAGAATGSFTAAAGDTVTVDAASTCTAIPAGVAGFSSADIAGDTLSNTGNNANAAHDIRMVSARYTPGWVILVFRFSRQIISSAGQVAAGLFGQIDIDADESVSTGLPPLMNAFGGNATQGAEYSISLFELDSVSAPVYNETFTSSTYMGRARVRFDADSVSISIPLAKFGNDDGNMTITAIVGTQDRPTDYAPNTGVITARVPASAGVAVRSLAPEHIVTPRRASARAASATGKWRRSR